MQTIEIRVDKIAKNVAEIAFKVGTVAGAQVLCSYIWQYYGIGLWAWTMIKMFKMGVSLVPQVDEIALELNEIFEANKVKKHIAIVQKKVKELNVGGIPSKIIDSKMPKLNVIWNFGTILGKQRSKTYTF